MAQKRRSDLQKIFEWLKLKYRESPTINADDLHRYFASVSDQPNELIRERETLRDSNDPRIPREKRRFLKQAVQNPVQSVQQS